MNTSNPVLIVILGLVLRFAVPILITALIVTVLRTLDARWQEEARLEEKAHAVAAMPCMKESGLTPEQTRLQLALHEQPCWQSQRSQSGYLNEACLDCEIFLNAPASAARVRVHI